MDKPKEQTTSVSDQTLHDTPIKKTPSFKRLSVIAFLILFAMVGVYVLSFTFASSPTPTTNLYSCPKVNGAYATLRSGSKDGDTNLPGDQCVSAIQWVLKVAVNLRGVTVNGTYDAATVSGVKKLQGFLRWNVDGILTPYEIDIISKYVAFKAIAVAPPPPPPPVNNITNGTQINAGNTGLAGVGLAPTVLSSVGSITYDASYNGQTITNKKYTGQVTVTGNNITIKNCQVLNGGLNSFGILVRGDNVKIQNCFITAPAGKSMYEPIYIDSSADGAVVSRNDISRGQNLMTIYGTNVSVVENYMHDVAIDSDPSDHPDGIEVYGGDTITIARNRIMEINQFDSPINVAPYGSYTLNALSVDDNFLDYGQEVVLIDLQNNNGFIRNTRIRRNVMGGHQLPSSNSQGAGPYNALNNYDRRAILQTEAQLAANPNGILWPTSGADVNYWGESSDLTPNRNGQIVIPN